MATGTAWPWLETPLVRSSLVPFVALWALAASALADGGATRLQSFLNDVTSLRSEFDQVVYDDKARKIDDARGTVYLQRPGRFRWDYVEPYPQEIVGDGEKVWIYDTELEQVTVRPFDDALGDTPVMLLSSARPVTESFRVEDVEGPEGYAWVQLTPLGEQMSFTGIRLAFDGEELRVMELEDNFGQLTRLQFSRVERNPALDPGIFRFEPPAGADVLQN
jgi:outer membrane lipoprotein carrier protein